MSVPNNIVNDLSLLTRVPVRTYSELTKKLNLCIGSIIADARAANEKAVCINIGIGTLSIDLIDMQCKFMPSKDLKATIKTCISSSEPVDPLELALEAAMAERLTAFCNEVL